MTDAYGERNGETEPPTIDGWYWWQGIFNGRSQAGLVKFDLPSTAFPTLVVSPEWFQGWITLEKMQGRWWGPLTPPWENHHAAS